MTKTIISNKTKLIITTIFAITGFSAQASDLPPPPPQVCADYPRECPSFQGGTDSTNTTQAIQKATPRTVDRN